MRGFVKHSLLGLFPLATSVPLALLTLGSVRSQAEMVVAQAAAHDLLNRPPRTKAFVHPKKQSEAVATGVAREGPGLAGSETQDEKTISALELGRLQANVLCVPVTRDFDPATRDGIRVFQASLGSSATGTVSSAAQHEKLVKRDRGAACPAGARNWWELQHFFLNGVEIPEKVKELQGFLGVSDAGQSGTLDEATRDKIKTARASMTDLKDVTKDATSEGWVTPAFFNRVRKEAMQKELPQNESKPQ